MEQLLETSELTCNKYEIQNSKVPCKQPNTLHYWIKCSFLV